jgi:hypothetical protein
VLILNSALEELPVKIRNRGEGAGVGENEAGCKKYTRNKHEIHI